MSSLAWSEAEGGAEVHAGAANLVVALLGEDLDTLPGRELAARLGDVERLIRRLEAVAVAAIGSADRRAVFAEDGHASVRGWVKASIRASDVEVTQRVRSAKLVASQPMCLDALASGQLGVAQVRELARVQATRAAPCICPARSGR